MSLIDLISPKWKHSNPEIRIDAVRQLGSRDLDLLKKIATTDKVARVRKTATEKITSREILEEIVKNESDKEVICSARNQLDRIYSELILESDDMDVRTFFLNEISDEDLVASIACRVDDRELRLAAVEKISSESLLCTVAESNCGAVAGEAVVDKVSNPDMLQRISEKGSNKKTRKKALDKLNAMGEKAPLVENQQQTALEHILKTVDIRLTPANRQKSAAVLKEAESSWKEHDPKGEHPLFKPFSDTVKSLKKQIAIYEERESTITVLEGLIEEAKALAHALSPESGQKAETLQRKWHDIDKRSIPYTTSRDLEKRFSLAVETVIAECERKIKAEEQREGNLKQMTALLERAEKLLAAGGWEKENIDRQVEEIATAWQKAVFDAPDTVSLKERFEHIVEDIRNQRAAYLREIEKIRKDQETRLGELLETVKKASAEEDKSLLKSAAIVKDAKNQWKEEGKNIPEIKSQLAPKFQEICDAFHMRLNEYKQNRDWEMWANLTQKTELCEIVESIAESLESEADLQEPATLVREARTKWKSIGPVARDKSDDIWARFRKGCDRVFTQCFEKKQALYEALTQAVQVSNYSRAAEDVKQIRKAWQAVGMLPLSIEKDLRDAFQSTCDRFFEEQRDFFRKRDDERHENLKIKTALCEDAEALSTSADWNTTAEKLKQFQQKWKETGPVPRQEGDALWGRFQNACNYFFDNLEKMKPENLAEKEALCEQVEKIVAGITDDSQIENAGRKVMELQRQWKEIGPVPKENVASIWERFHTACEEMFDIRREYYKKREDAWSENEALKETLVTRAEALADSMDWDNTPEKLKTIQAEWKNIPSGSRKAEQVLWERLSTACDAFFTRRRSFFEGREKERQENLKKKEALCLTMELLAKLLLDDSILDYNENIPIAEQLSKAMDLRDEVVVPGEETVTRNNILRKIKQVQAEWKEIGPVPNDYDRQLRERFQKAADLLYSSKKGGGRKI